MNVVCMHHMKSEIMCVLQMLEVRCGNVLPVSVCVCLCVCVLLGYTIPLVLHEAMPEVSRHTLPPLPPCPLMKSCVCIQYLLDVCMYK